MNENSSKENGRAVCSREGTRKFVTSKFPTLHKNQMSPQPDCCQRSTLRRLRTVDESQAGQIVLELCEACRTYWLVSVLGHMDEDHAQDLEIEDIERISDEEGSGLLLACGR